MATITQEPIISFMLLQVDLGKEEKVMQELRRLSDDIKEARALLGIYDVVIKIVSEKKATMDATIQMVRRLNHIRSTITLPVSDVYGGWDN